MKKYSINPKLNKCLNGIETALLSILDTKAESLEQIRKYVREYRNEPDCNIAQHGNVLYTYPSYAPRISQVRNRLILKLSVS